MPTLVTRPYSGTGDASLPDSVKNLPAGAKKIWVAAFNSAWDNYDAEKSEQPSRESYAMAVAWAAVNKSYKKNSDGDWVERSLIHYSFGAPFTSVRRAADGRVYWRTTCSNDGVDKYATRMTTDLHDDFVRHAEQGTMPLLTVAHFYKLAPVGITQRLYRDGRRLKAEGVFFTDREVAREAGLELDDVELAVAQATAAKATEEGARPPAERTIKTSIGFINPAVGGIETEDLGVIAYTRGTLAEIATTTRPGNSRVDLVAEQRSGDMTARMNPDVMEDDAAAIVGPELAAALRDRFEQLRGKQRAAGLEEEDAVELIYRSLSDIMRASVPTHKGRAVETTSWDRRPDRFVAQAPRRQRSQPAHRPRRRQEDLGRRVQQRLG